MRVAGSFIGFFLVILPLTSCRESTPTGPDEAHVYPPPELETPFDLGTAPVDWLLAQGHALTSLTSDDFSDLQFLKGLVADKRIVQLGESGHGVAEFSQAKVRLIEFLHEEMGFDVVAFESPMFECFAADRGVDSVGPAVTLARCLFTVWEVAEVVPLFEYIQATRGTSHPLRIAGFDIQSDPYRAMLLGRPAFLRGVVEKVDPDYALEVERRDAEWIHSAVAGRGRLAAYSRSFYVGLLEFLDDHMAELERGYPPSSPMPRIARQTVWSLLEEADKLLADVSYEARDRGMATNVAVLARRVYPRAKIVIWAHNAHIRYANRRVYPPSAPWRSLPLTMGELIKGQFSNIAGVYTLGLYMYEGRAAWNNRQRYDIDPAPANSLEGYLFRAGRPFLLVDFENDRPADAPEWVSQEVQARTWGTAWLTFVPAEQYDGVVFVREVHPPHYGVGG